VYRHSPWAGVREVTSDPPHRGERHADTSGTTSWRQPRSRAPRASCGGEQHGDRRGPSSSPSARATCAPEAPASEIIRIGCDVRHIDRMAGRSIFAMDFEIDREQPWTSHSLPWRSGGTPWNAPRYHPMYPTYCGPGTSCCWRSCSSSRAARSSSTGRFALCTSGRWRRRRSPSACHAGSAQARPAGVDAESSRAAATARAAARQSR
jgi:hypothetical protein